MGLFREANNNGRRYASVLICGESGIGKTMLAMQMASLLANASGGKAAIFDTEATQNPFHYLFPDILYGELNSPFSPSKLIDSFEQLSQPENQEIDTVILDSLTSFWSDDGGLLAVAEGGGKRSMFGGWPAATKQQRKMMDAVLKRRCNTICTARMKNEYKFEDDTGKKTIMKDGLKPDLRESMLYDFDVVFYLLKDSTNSRALRVIKDRLYWFGSSSERYGDFFDSRFQMRLKLWFLGNDYCRNYVQEAELAISASETIQSCREVYDQAKIMIKEMFLPESERKSMLDRIIIAKDKRKVSLVD